MSPSRYRKAPSIISKLPTMKWKSSTRLPRIGDAKIGKIQCKPTTKRTRTWLRH